MMKAFTGQLHFSYACNLGQDAQENVAKCALNRSQMRRKTFRNAHLISIFRLKICVLRLKIYILRLKIEIKCASC